MKTISTVVWLLLVAQSVIANNVEIEIEDYWGESTFNIGGSDDQRSLDLKCVVTDPDPTGRFEWAIGGNVVKSDNAGVEMATSGGQTSYSQVFSYSPKQEDNRKNLMCKYIQNDAFGNFMHESISQFKIKIQKNVFPESPVMISGQFREGEAAKLPVTMELFPEPKNSDFLWTIEDPNSGAKVQLTPGQSEGEYVADSLESLGNDKYRATLSMQSMNFNKNYYLVHKAGDNRSLKLEFARGREPMPTENPNEVTTVEPESTRMGPGLWIIIALVILIVLACVGYCVWQKCFRKKPEIAPIERNPDPEKGAYKQAPTQDTK